MSRWLVGSSRSSTSGSEASTWASSTRSLKPPERVESGVAVDLGRDAEPLEHLAGAGFEGIAVVAEDQVLQLGVAVGVELLLGVGEQALLLDHRLPDVVVAHHGDFEDGHVLVPEVVLLEDAQLEALGHRDSPLAGDVVPGEDLEEGGFARAVGPHEAIAVARVELNRDPLEQRLGAEGLSKVGYGDHRAGNDSRMSGVRCSRAGSGAGGRDILDGRRSSGQGRRNGHLATRKKPGKSCGVGSLRRQRSSARCHPVQDQDKVFAEMRRLRESRSQRSQAGQHGAPS